MSDAILKQLADVIDSRKGGDAEASYVARLFAKGDDAILKKIGEEATEAVMAAKRWRSCPGSSARRRTCGSTA